MDTDTEKQRQCRHDDARLTESGNTSFSWYLQSRYPTENGCQRAFEWIRASKAQLVFVSALECRDIETALYDRTGSTKFTLFETVTSPY